MVWTQISASGLELLSKIDPEITQIPGELLGHFDRKELGEFIRLLELARKNCMDTQTPVSCEGEICETSEFESAALKVFGAARWAAPI